MANAVVIGAGPNGLVAANKLADAGWSVVVLEAADAPGGAVRSSELIEPGFVTDHFSAFYPLAAASPAIRALELERWGLRFRHGPLVLAHPASDGTCVVLSRDLDETAASLDSFARGDGDAWRHLMELWRRIRDPLLRGMVTPMPPVRTAAELTARLGPRGGSRRNTSAAPAVRASSPGTHSTPTSRSTRRSEASSASSSARSARTSGTRSPRAVRGRCRVRSYGAPRHGESWS